MLKEKYEILALLAIACLFFAFSALGSTDLPTLPEGIASFGAAVAGDDLVVFGGHVGKTHQHSIENLSHRFLHLDLQNPETGWQDLGQIDGLQGLPLVAQGRQVCRVGGLRADNHVGSDEDLHSIAEVRCFDLDRRQWRELPPLPEPRSSHDAVIFDDHLFVIGGWQLRGAGEKPIWRDDMAVLNLAEEQLGWTTVPQPFRRRALAVAAAAGKVYAFGGLGEDGTSRGVESYDLASATWSSEPDLPAMTGRLKGFGVSAFGVDDRIYLSGADGHIHALDTTTGSWETHLGKLATPRFFHRLLPHRDRLLFLGGAARQGHLDTVESWPMAALVAGSSEMPSPEKRSTTVSWPGFRGLGSGPLQGADLPLKWSGDESFAWQVDIPGYGQSSPVLWDGRVFVTSVDGSHKETLLLSALSAESGEVLWRRRFPASQEIESSDMVTRGAPTPAVDAERVYAFWESGDVISLTHEGETIWQRSLTRDYGEFRGNHGVASSPVLTQDAVVIQVAHEGPSYFVALEKSTGETHWKVDRPARVAWTTPVVVPGKNGQEIISSGAGRLEALDARNGQQLWYRDGIEKNHAPSVVVDRGLVIVASSEPGHNFAVDRLGQGQLADDHIAWTAEGVTSGFGSPVVQGDCVLFVNKAGVVSCVDRESGEERWKHRLGDACWATPVVVSDRVYFFTKKGKTIVLQTGEDKPEILAENPLEIEETVYGVAPTDDAFFIRTGSQLIKIGSSAPPYSAASTSQVAR